MADGSLGTARGAAIIDISQAQRALRQLEKDAAKSQAVINGFAGKSQPIIKPQLDTRALATIERQRIASDGRIRESQESAAARIKAVELQANAAVERARIASAGAVERAQVAAAQRVATASERIQAQQQRAQSPVALPRTFAGVTSEGAGQIVATAAGLLSLQAIGDRFRQGFKLQSVLDENALGFRTLSTDSDKAGRSLAGATKFARDFGFTQREISNALAGSTQQIDKSALGIEKILEVLARLQSRGPGKTFDDVNRSVRELASGDYVSIADQFNIPKKAALELRDAVASGQDVFAVLDQYLNRVGATAEVLANRMQGAAGATRIAAQAGEDLSLAFGKVATSQVVLDNITISSRNLSDALSNVATLFNSSGTVAGYNAQILTGASSFEEYQQRIAAVNAQLPFFVSGTQAVNAAQFAFAQQLIATGVAAQDAYNRIIQLPVGLQEIINLGANASAVLQNAVPVLTQLALSGEIGASGVQALVTSFQQTGDVAAFNAGLSALSFTVRDTSAAVAQNAARNAELAAEYQRLHGTTVEQINATNTLAVEQLAASANAQILASAQTSVEAAALAAANGSGTLEARAAALAAQLGITKDKALELLGALQAVALASNVGGGAYDYMIKQSIAQNEAWARAKKAAEDLASARSADVLATGTQAQKIAELIKLRDKYTAGTAEYIRANTQVKAALQALEAANNKGTTKGVNNAASEAQARLAAQRALMSDTALLTSLEREYASVQDKSSTRALTLLKQVQDVKARIAAAGKTAADQAQREAEANAHTAEQAAERFKRAEEALLDPASLLARRKAEQAATTDATRRLELEREIRDLTEQVARTQEQAQQKAIQAQQDIIDAQIQVITNARAERDAVKDEAEARRVLASNATAEMKQEAQWTLDQIALERQRRALQTQNGGTATPVGGAAFSNGKPVLPSLALDSLPTPPAAPAVIASLPQPALPAGTIAAGGGPDALVAAIQSLIGQTAIYVNGVLTPQTLGGALDHALGKY